MRFKVIFFILVSFLLLTINLGKWGVTETSEARYAEISREMFQSKDYLHPKLLNIHHYHKPPLTYYITTAGYYLFGVNEFGARFFLQVAIIIQLLLVFCIAKLLYKDETIAFTAMLIYFSIPIVLISSRNLTTDAYLNTSILAVIYFWLKYKFHNLKKIYLYLFFLTLGVSFEIKGPVAWLFPLIFILYYKVIIKDRIKITTHHVLGLILLFATSLAWYIKVLIENQHLWNYFVEGQVVSRITSNAFNRAKPFWYYLLTAPLVGLPWLVFLVQQSFKKFKALKTKKTIEYVLLLTIVTVFILFSIFKTKLILYILPMFGFVAVLMAKCLAGSNQKTLKVYNNIILGLIILILVVILGMSVIKINFEFNITIGIALAVLSIIAIIIISKRFYKNPFLKTAYFGYVFGCIILVFGTFFLIKNQTKLNSTKEVVNFIKTEIKEADNIVVYNYLLPSVKYYAPKKNVITLNDGYYTVQRETQFEINDNWKSFNIDLRTENGKAQTQKILSKHTVLIARKKYPLPKEFAYLIKNLTHIKDFDKWIIYY